MDARIPEQSCYRGAGYSMSPLGLVNLGRDKSFKPTNCMKLVSTRCSIRSDAIIRSLASQSPFKTSRCELAALDILPQSGELLTCPSSGVLMARLPPNALNVTLVPPRLGITNGSPTMTAESMEEGPDIVVPTYYILHRFETGESDRGRTHG